MRFVSVARGVLWFLGRSPFANRPALFEIVVTTVTA
jgi:hypothetical protein